MRPDFRVIAALTMSIALLFTLTPEVRADVDLGLRGGFSSDPDQFLFGLQLEFAPIAKNLYVVPSVEAGVGDDAFSISTNGDLQYRFEVDGDVRPYAGGGLSLYFIDFDRGDNTELGVNVVGGVIFERRRPIFLEFKAGLTDEVPDWKIIVGVLLR